MRWSVNGANNLAKLKYRKSNGELTETIRRYSTPLLQALSFGEILNDVLSAAQTAKKDGKGNPYIDSTMRECLARLVEVSRKFDVKRVHRAAVQMQVAGSGLV